MSRMQGNHPHPSMRQGVPSSNSVRTHAAAPGSHRAEEQTLLGSHVSDWWQVQLGWPPVSTAQLQSHGLPPSQNADGASTEL